MKRPPIVRQSGPYRCVSSGPGGGKIEVFPSWPQYPSPPLVEGSLGPGAMMRLTLAKALEGWLNAPYKKAKP